MPFAVKIPVIMVATCSMSQGGSGQIGKLFCEALGYEIKQYGRSVPKVDVHYKDFFFFFFLMDGIFFPSHLSVVGYSGTHTHKRARTHTYTRAHAYVNTHTTIFDGCVIFSYPSRI